MARTLPPQQVSLFCSDPAQCFLGNTQIGRNHTQRNTVIDVVVGFAEMLVLLFGCGKPHGGDALHIMPENSAHGKPGIPFHLREMVEQETQVIDFQTKAGGCFKRVDIINVPFLLDKTSRRIDPFVFCTKVFGDFPAVFDKINAHQTLLNEVTFSANVVGVVYQFTLLKRLTFNSFGQFAF